MRYTYTVKNGETPADVAERFTGRRDTFRDMVPLNPVIEQMTGSVGAPLFKASAWRDGMTVNIPQRWAAKGPMNQASGSVGCGRALSLAELEELGLGMGTPTHVGLQTADAHMEENTEEYCKPGWVYDPATNLCNFCPSGMKYDFAARACVPIAPTTPESSPKSTKHPNAGKPCSGGTAIINIKPYQYVVQSGDINEFWKIPGKFGMGTAKEMWQELRDANLGWKKGLGINDYGDCMLKGLIAGDKLNVPGDWLEPPPHVTTVPFGIGEQCPEGQTLINGTCVSGGTEGGCPPGFVLNSSGQCVAKGSGLDTISRTDTDSNTLWLLLAAGAAVAGGIYMYSARKGRK